MLVTRTTVPAVAKEASTVGALTAQLTRLEGHYRSVAFEEMNNAITIPSPRSSFKQSIISLSLIHFLSTKKLILIHSYRKPAEVLTNRSPYTLTLQKEFHIPLGILPKTSCDHLLQPWPLSQVAYRAKRCYFGHLACLSSPHHPRKRKTTVSFSQQQQSQSLISGLMNLTPLNSACVVLGENEEVQYNGRAK